MSTLLPLVRTTEKSVKEPDHKIFLLARTRVEEPSVLRNVGACWSTSRRKRVFDIFVSLAVLGILGFPMLLIILCIWLSSRGSAIFVQTRVGQEGHPFSIYKFRTMRDDAASCGIGLTKSGDERVTWIGRWLRKMKLDELPQFYNVLRGDMSVVGPRPKLAEYADDLNFAYRPGITGAASLTFRCEEDLLASIPAHEVEQFYQERIKPEKASIDSRYMLHATFRSDLWIVLATLVSSLRPSESPAIVPASFGMAPTGIPVELGHTGSARPLRLEPNQEEFSLD